jgi:hydroxymethylglutaryl-CoA lyase
VCESFARDGLQHETAFIPTETKVAAIELFAEIGFRRIEATSFSHPERVPQFADAEEVLRRIDRSDGVVYKATCVNVKAVERAVAATEAGYGPTEISLVVSASETHSLKNVRRTHEQMRAELEESLRIAANAALPAAGTVATAFGCPFTGEVSDAQVETWVEFFAERGVGTVSLGDTTGMGNPASVERRFTALRARWPELSWIGHFHDTRGTAIANCVAALRAGVEHLDSALGGLGGHPPYIVYGAGSTGNVATEDLVAMLEDMGVATEVDLRGLLEASAFAERAVGRDLQAKVRTAGLSRDLLGS